MAFSAGTFVRQPYKKPVTAGEGQGKEKWHKGNKYERFRIQSTTADQWFGEIWILASTIVTEAADPATVTVA